MGWFRFSGSSGKGTPKNPPVDSPGGIPTAKINEWCDLLSQYGDATAKYDRRADARLQTKLEKAFRERSHVFTLVRDFPDKIPEVIQRLRKDGLAKLTPEITRKWVADITAAEGARTPSGRRVGNDRKVTIERPVQVSPRQRARADVRAAYTASRVDKTKAEQPPATNGHQANGAYPNGHASVPSSATDATSSEAPPPATTIPPAANANGVAAEDRHTASSTQADTPAKKSKKIPGPPSGRKGPKAPPSRRHLFELPDPIIEVPAEGAATPPATHETPPPAAPAAPAAPAEPHVPTLSKPPAVGMSKGKKWLLAGGIVAAAVAVGAFLLSGRDRAPEGSEPSAGRA